MTLYRTILFLLCALCVSVANAASVHWTNIVDQYPYTSGDTVNLHGTFTNSCSITNNNVTFILATDAKFSAPYWNPSAFLLDTRTNVIVDGGVNGLVVATANGTGLAYTNRSVGVKINAGYSNTVKNMTVSNMYVRIAGSGENSPDAAYGAFTTGIWLVGGSYINVLNNSIYGSEGGISIQSWGGMSTNHDFNIFGNKVYRNCISMTFAGSGGTNATFYNLNIISNRFDHWSEWAATAPGSSNLHRDGIYMFLTQALVQDYHVINIVYPTSPIPFPTNYPTTYTTNGVTVTSSNLAGTYFIDASGNNWTNAFYSITNSTGKIFTLKTNGVSIASADMAAGGDGYWQYGFFLGSSIVWGGIPAVQSNGLPYVIFGPYDLNPTCSISNVAITHNYFGPDVCAPGTAGGTAAIFMTWYSTNQNAVIAKNFRVGWNIASWTNAADAQSVWANGLFVCNAYGDSILNNNTYVATAFIHDDGYTYGQGAPIGASATPLITVNNFTKNAQKQNFYDANTGLTNYAAGFFVDYNCYALPFGLYVPGTENDFYGPPATPYGSDRGYSWIEWTNSTFFTGVKLDAHGTTNTPSINAITYQPTTNDVVLNGTGTNMTVWFNLRGVSNLVDYAGVPLPTTGPWPIGALVSGTNQVATYFLNVINGTGSAVGLTAGQVVSISTNCTIFSRWTGPGTNYISANTASASLTMPAADTIITAECTNMILAGNVYLPILIR